MPHWRSFTDREYIYAYDLQGKDVTLTIELVTGGAIPDSKGRKTKKPIVFFRETKVDPDTRKKKGLALNATNGKTIAAMYGNETDDWVGKRVTLYPTTTEMAGQTVECIRVRPRVPPAASGKGRAPEPEQAAPPDPDDDVPTGDPEPPEPGE